MGTVKLSEIPLKESWGRRIKKSFSALRAPTIDDDSDDDDDEEEEEEEEFTR